MTTRITYATIRDQAGIADKEYEAGLATSRAWFGKEYPFYVNGEARIGAGYTEERSPADQDLVVGYFGEAQHEDARDAVASAKGYFPEWANTDWRERVRILRSVAQVISSRVGELAALIAYEVGKTRAESKAEVTETADLITYYCAQMEDHNGFVTSMASQSEGERNESVLRPYGVWTVISPFNFPMALAGGPAGCALVTGNTVILKPSHQAYLSGLKLYEAMRDGGVPAAAFHVLTGPGAEVGAALWQNPDVDGVTFTGSYEVGMNLFREFGKERARPTICEMGGKNPAIVSAKADIEKAAEGVMWAAFGYSGQKCSACSRVYVEEPVYEEFVAQLVDKGDRLSVGLPWASDTAVGPVISKEALKRFEKAGADVKQAGGRILRGGRRLTEGNLARGFFVEPTVVEVRPDHRVWREELFVPFVAVTAVDSLGDALNLANRTAYGLTAGFYSEDSTEIERFVREIEAGVVYINRRAGATTGAWPGMQPFGGWKSSGTTGRGAGGPYYIQQYLREQSRTIIRE